MGQDKDILRTKADNYAHAVYALSRKLPADEKFGLTSQLRRAALSVPLNIVEGYSRQSLKAEVQFLLISFGSLKESQYVLDFAAVETYLKPSEIAETLQSGDELARILWAKVQRFKTKISNS